VPIKPKEDVKMFVDWDSVVNLKEFDSFLISFYDIFHAPKYILKKGFQ
jgi:hypothetical protein